MKKLIIATLAATSALLVNAAAANWTASAVNIYDGTGGTATANKYSGSAYIFDASSVSQSALYSIISAADSTFDITKESGYVAKGTVSSGSMPSSTKFEYGTQWVDGDTKQYSFYFVLLEDEQVYFSNITTPVDASGTTTAKGVAFGNQKSGSSVAPTATGYAGAGAWSSVPEPTSGLLMLLGFAGLALRRKQK